MLSTVSIRCLFVTTLFLFQIILGVANEITLETPEKIEAYFLSSVEDIRNTVEEIMKIRSDEQTYENTLRSWNRLMDKAAMILDTLTATESSQSIHDFRSLLEREIFQNIDLYNILLSYAQKSLHDKILNSYQYYVTQRFLENVNHRTSESTSFYLKGTAQDKIATDKNFTVFNFNMRTNAEEFFPRLAAKILNAHADIVCLHEITTVEILNDAYDTLKENYGHFYTTMDICGFSADSLHSLRGLLIASKYPIENLRCTPFSIADESPGFIDFVLKNNTGSLGHMYITDLKFSSDQQSVYLKMKQLQQILETMISDFQENIPFLLCGSLGIPESLEEEGQDLIKAYFSNVQLNRPRTDYTLPPNSLSVILGNSPRHHIESSSIFLSDHHSAQFSLIQQDLCENYLQQYLASNHQNIIFYESKDFLIECKGNKIKAYGEANKDDQGNSSAETGVEYSYKDEDKKGPRISGDAHVRQESRGGKSKTEMGVKGSLELDF